MRAPLLLGWVVAALSFGACANGGSETIGFPQANNNSHNLVGDAGGPCNNLECLQVDCVSQGKPDTTLNGVVYDPAGNLPIYNAFVYVPNAKPDPIVVGTPACSACQAPASGSPLVYDSTDAKGVFHISHAPAGDNVPLVLQVGKWRRQLVVPHIEACTDNAFDDPSVVRLPANGREGDMPLMALASGCDAAECFLNGVGIDASEFTGPGGGGHVHVYGGKYAGITVDGMGDAYSLWSSPANLLKYDLILAACECAVYPRDTEGPAYEAMRAYVDGGGRFYSTHFHFNWFAPPTGPVDFQNVAQWQDEYVSSGFTTFFVDTTFPKGRAFADWLDDNQLSAAYGGIDLTDTRDSVAEVTGATRWIYGADTPSATPYTSKYLSFNTPIGTPVAGQCGRATFSDVHLSGISDQPGAFPAECAARPGTHGVDERALEFLFFDLVSCIQDDTQEPSSPPTQ
jgi:hypothetical protein